MSVASREILCTLGPASMDRPVIRRLAELGATLFRINLSHTRLEDLAGAIDFIAGCTSVPICLDTEGAQIRTGRADGTIEIRESSLVRVDSGAAPASATQLGFYPPDAVDLLAAGDFVGVDFDSVLLQVVGREDDAVLMRALNGGSVGSNKAVAVERDIVLPPLTDKDRAAIGIGVDMGIRNFALSFANRAEDVDELRGLAGPDAFVISKIECRNGLTNLDAIARLSDALLIDRGDLSRQVPIEQLPRVQKAIIERARRLERKVYVATNLLESMVTAPTPTRAEVNDIYNTLLDGADGLVLAAETAVGAYPVRCTGMIVKMMREVEAGAPEDSAYPDDPFSLLVEPHGGLLVHREVAPADAAAIGSLPALEIGDTDLLDCVQIAHGTYSPLTGFMDREALAAVLDGNRLPDGTVWTMPVVLQVPNEKARGLGVGERVALTGADGRRHALLDVNDVYTVDLDQTARKWFGTASPDHPGVARFVAAGDTFIGGAVSLAPPGPAPRLPYELDPHQTRYIFSHKGWMKVVGFHGRNVCHRVHEHIQVRALEETGADGLYISPVTGPKKRHDFLSGPIMRSYQLLLEQGVYPHGKVVLGNFSTYSRYCGPREAVFTALCRKNMGCSHFIIGRDHTGVGDFYPADGNRRMFDDLGDIGIAPVFFDDIGWDPGTESYRAMESTNGVRAISGTEVRDTLNAGERLPDWVIRDAIQDMLLAELAAGQSIFHD